MKSRAEVEQLKKDWFEDPCWDIEDTEGFDGYYFELKDYRMACERVWRKKAELDCSFDMARYILALEDRLFMLENQIIKSNPFYFTD